MKKLAFLAAAAILGLSAPAMAATPGWYAGAGYTAYDADNADLGAVTGRLGYQFTPYWGVEGEGSFGVEDDGDTELDNAWGLYGTGSLPVSERVDLFGRVGYQTMEIDGPGAGDDDGLGYGAGVNVRLTPTFGVRGEYTRLDGDEDTDAWALSGVVHF